MPEKTTAPSAIFNNRDLERRSPYSARIATRAGEPVGSSAVHVMQPLQAHLTHRHTARRAHAHSQGQRFRAVECVLFAVRTTEHFPTWCTIPIAQHARVHARRLLRAELPAWVCHSAQLHESAHPSARPSQTAPHPPTQRRLPLMRIQLPLTGLAQQRIETKTGATLRKATHRLRRC